MNSSTRTRCPSLGWLLIPVLVWQASAQQPVAPTAAEYALVKHRVEVSGGSWEQGSPATQVAVNGSKEFVETPLPAGAESIRTKDHASALDLLKSRVTASEVVRLVEPPKSGTADQAPIAYMIQGRFAGASDSGSAVVRVVNKASGAVVASAEARAASPAVAIGLAMDQVEKELLKQAWRCRVVAVNDGKVVIPFGRLDGVRKGNLLRGYVLSQEARNDDQPITELVLMTAGKRAGDYRIIEAGEEFSQLEPISDAAALAKGDVLEAPAAGISEIHRSRSSTIWDKLYDKK